VSAPRFKEKPAPWATGASVLQYTMQRFIDALAAGDYVRAETLLRALAAILPSEGDREALNFVLSLDPEDPAQVEAASKRGMKGVRAILQDMAVKLQGLRQEHDRGYLTPSDYTALRNALLAQMRVNLALDLLGDLKSLRELLWKPERRLA